MSTRKTNNGFQSPPHANAKVHKKIMAKLKKMSSKEIFQTAVEAGIYTPDGKLTKHYTRDDETPMR
jgi:roadblock/LC7 domain-containing protein